MDHEDRKIGVKVAPPRLLTTYAKSCKLPIRNSAFLRHGTEKISEVVSSEKPFGLQLRITFIYIAPSLPIF